MRFPELWKQAFLAAITGLASRVETEFVADEAARLADRAVEEWAKRLTRTTVEDVPRFKSDADADTDYTNFGGGR